MYACNTHTHTHIHTHTHYYTQRLPSPPRRSRPCASLLHTIVFTTHYTLYCTQGLPSHHPRRSRPTRESWPRSWSPCTMPCALAPPNIQTCIYIYMYVCVCVCLCVCLCVCVYMYTYVHTYIHTYTHTYIHTPPCARARPTSESVITFIFYVLF